MTAGIQGLLNLKVRNVTTYAVTHVAVIIIIANGIWSPLTPPFMAISIQIPKRSHAS